MSTARICFVVAATLVLSSCAGAKDTPPPPPIAPLPPVNVAVSGSKIAPPAPPTPIKVAPPVVRAPAPVELTQQAVARPAELVTLDLKALKKQLKETKSIGLFSKISLKNKVDDLLDQFRKYYQGKGKMDLAELRESYNLLMMKVLSMLQDADQTLSAAIVSSREAIWDLLSDPKKFATLDI